MFFRGFFLRGIDGAFECLELCSDIAKLFRQRLSRIGLLVESAQ